MSEKRNGSNLGRRHTRRSERGLKPAPIRAVFRPNSGAPTVGRYVWRSARAAASSG